jgi:hypothetical protein
VRPLLDDPDAAPTSVGVAEVIDHLVRIAGIDEEDATLDLAQLDLLDLPTGRPRDRRRSRSAAGEALPPDTVRGEPG